MFFSPSSWQALPSHCYLSLSSRSSGKLPVESRCVPGSGASYCWLFSKCWMMFLTLPGLTGGKKEMKGTMPSVQGSLFQPLLPASPEDRAISKHGWEQQENQAAWIWSCPGPSTTVLCGLGWPLYHPMSTSSSCAKLKDFEAHFPWNYFLDIMIFIKWYFCSQKHD